MILVVAATKAELAALRHADVFACGVGPVDAAAATARALAELRPDVLLHVGIAGARGLTPGALVIGTEAFYHDISAEIPVVDRVEPDAGLLALMRAAFPDALGLPIGTSAAVGGPAASGHLGVRVEAMEGFAVLRAAELAGVSAVEVRAVSNELDEPDRARWRVDDAVAALGEAVPRLLTELHR